MSTENKRKNHVFRAKLADQAERYEDKYSMNIDSSKMVESMKSVAILNVELTLEERNLLSVAYKNATSARRVSWNVLSSMLQKEDAIGNEIYVNLIKGYRKKIEDELSAFCSDILMILDNNLLTSTRSVEATVFYLKMRGDYFRYLAEFKSGLEREEAVDQSMKGYEEAFAAAETELLATHPIRLGLALNFSIFYYEIMNNCERAYQMAKQSFDDAIAELETSYDQESYKDITLIMQLLRDSLTLYSPNLLDDTGDKNLKDAEAKPAEL